MIESLVTGLGTSVRVQHLATAEELVTALEACWAEPRADVFDFDLAVVPGPGFQRWLSQRLATARGRDSVRAGVEFSTLPRLMRRLDEDDDEWRPERLTWLIQRLAVGSTDPGLAPLTRHLAAAREPYATCSRVARRFAAYAVHRPAMLQAWAAGDDVDPVGAPLAENAWQAHLWRLVAREIGSTPADRHALLLDRLREGPAAGVPARVAVLAVRPNAAAAEVLDALAVHHRVDFLALTPSPGRWRPAPGSRPVRADLRRPLGHPLNDALAIVADEAALLLPPPAGPRPATPAPTLLGRLQADLRADTAPRPRDLEPDDDSIQVHLSHGLDRQVEVLREVLTSLFAADPSLEPRDVAVVTPEVDAVAALLDAAFTTGALGHPAQGFRLQVADRSVAQTNPLVGLLLQLLRLPDGRLEAATLLDLCAEDAVARRFGFGADSRDRLVDLVERSGIRWGLSARHRGRFGLEGFPQNTWFAGVQRMLLGVTLSEQGLVTAGTTLPLDDVDSSDIDLIGGLTELIGRLQRVIAGFETDATAAEWSARCRTAVEGLVSLPPALQWQLADLWAGLKRFTSQAGDGAVLGRQTVQRALADQFRSTPARGAFGNGSLIVCGPQSLRHVPHRVTVLLGFDPERLPRPPRRGGDDLLEVQPLAGDPSAGLDDRQALLDAVHATRDTLVLVLRGRSESSNKEVPLAAPVQELLDCLEQTAPGAGATVVRHHPLQPFDPAYFDPSVKHLSSADPIAFAGARALQSSTETTRRPYLLGRLTPWSLDDGVELDDLVAFFSHPVRTLLRRRAGVTLAEPRESPNTIPIELDSLSRWQVGDRVLRHVVAGDDLEAVRTAEWLRGGVPPFDLGQSVLDGVLADVRAVQRNLPPWYSATPAAHDVDVELEVPGHGRVALTGRVMSHDGAVLQVEFSSLQPRHRLATWLRLLALTAAGLGNGHALVIGKSRAATLAAPSPTESRRLLSGYLALYATGMQRPLPAMPRVCSQWAALRLAERDPRDPKAGEPLLKRAWEYDSDENWKAFFDYPSVLELPSGELQLPGDTRGEPRLVGALSMVIWRPLLASEGTP